MIFATYTMKMFQSNEDGGGLSLNKGKSSIAVVEVNGVIMESKKTIELLEKAHEDKTTKAIIMRVNSPGGAVGPTEEIYEEIRRIDELYTSSEGKEGKPIYASFGSVAASGGYYIGAATRRIYTNAGTMTGSIGVIMHFLNNSKLMEWAKLKPYNIKSGRYKDIGNGGRDMTDEERDMLEGMVAGVHDQFRKDILRTREKKIKGDLVELSQGQIFSGRQAVEFGLADKIASLWEAGREIHEELKLEGKFGLKFIKKKKKPKIFELVDNLDEAITDVRSMIGANKVDREAPVLMYHP